MVRNLLASCFALLVSFVALPLSAEQLAGLGGQISLDAPASWKKAQPRSQIIEYEFQAPGAEGKDPARVTMMAASGSIDDNIARWIGQFKLAEGKEPTKAKTETAAALCTS